MFKKKDYLLMSGEASMMYSKTSEQRFEISERNSYENVLEKRIL